jgi:hypothetical protein
MATIDRDRLLELAAIPVFTTEAIAKELGLSNVQALYYEFNKDQALKDAYAAARREAQTKKAEAKTSARAPHKKKRASPSTPPPQWSYQERTISRSAEKDLRGVFVY